MMSCCTRRGSLGAPSLSLSPPAHLGEVPACWSLGFLRCGLRHWGVLQEGAHSGLVGDKAAFSGAAKLRGCRGVLLRSWPLQGAGWQAGRPSVLAQAQQSQEGIMPLFLLRSAMVLRLWLALVALLASFLLRSCVVSRLCPWPRGLPVTVAELSCRYLRDKTSVPRGVR